MTHLSTRAPAAIQPIRHPCAGTVWTLPFDGRGEAECAFCGHRARRIGPPAPLEPAAVLLGRLTRDLRRHQKRLQWVWLAPASDPFAPSAAADLAGPALQIAGLVLRHGIGVTLRTRGGLSEAQGLVTLARRHPGLLRVELGFFSEDRQLVARWERGTAPVVGRLALAAALRRAGAEVVARVGPILPLVNDGERALIDLTRSLGRNGIHTLVPQWIEAAPGLVKQVEREVSRSAARMLAGWFTMERPSSLPPRRHLGHEGDLFAAAEARQDAEHRGTQLPARVRQHVLSRFRAAADATGAQLLVCPCSDPDHGTGVCLLGPGTAQRGGQLDLFTRSG